MARPTKQGIDYFPLDVDLDSDDKLAMVIGEFGVKGELIFIKLLSFLYKNYGYFLPWDEMEQLKFAKRVVYIDGASVNLINEVVARLVKWGIMDNTVFNSFHILTSARIQKTWLEASRKRKDRIIDYKIWLLGDNGAFKAEETKEKAEETTQSKVKKSKENKSLGLSPENLNSFEKFTVWAKANAPNILKMSAPLDAGQLVKLKSDFTTPQIQELFLAMHNRKNLVKDNVSAFLTFINWAKRRQWGKIDASEIDEKIKKAIFG